MGNTLIIHSSLATAKDVATTHADWDLDSCANLAEDDNDPHILMPAVNCPPAQTALASLKGSTEYVEGDKVQIWCKSSLTWLHGVVEALDECGISVVCGSSPRQRTLAKTSCEVRKVVQVPQLQKIALT